MNFYFNVRQHGNKLLVRSFEDGKRQQYDVPYQPHLFVKSNKKRRHFRVQISLWRSS